MKLKKYDRVRQPGGLTGTVVLSYTGEAERDGRFYAGKQLVQVHWEDGTYGRWPADSLEKTR